MRYAVVSPHFDDAVISMAGTVLALGGPATFITVHGGVPREAAETSPWDQNCGFLSGREAARFRREEELRAVEIIGAESVCLPIPDDPYIAEEGVDRAVAAELAPVLTEVDAVLAPAGIGSHPGHLRTRDAVLAVMRQRPKVDVYLYADLPYASWAPNWADDDFGTVDEHGDVFGGLLPLLATYHLAAPKVTHLAPDIWVTKRSAVFCHASQLGPLSQVWPNFLAQQGPLRRELLWRAVPIGGEPPAWQPWVPAVGCRPTAENMAENVRTE
jgi:LmbE family N-acetylglucosaminyl deacetylase